MTYCSLDFGKSLLGINVHNVVGAVALLVVTAI